MHYHVAATLAIDDIINGSKQVQQALRGTKQKVVNSTLWYITNILTRKTVENAYLNDMAPKSLNPIILYVFSLEALAAIHKCYPNLQSNGQFLLSSKFVIKIQVKVIGHYEHIVKLYHIDLRNSCHARIQAVRTPMPTKGKKYLQKT